MPLRTLDEKDLPLILKWRNAPEIRNKMFTSHLISKSEHWEWYKNNLTDDSTLWYIHENINNIPDGVIGFTGINKNKKTALWGFYLSPDAEKGSGLLLGYEGLNQAFDILQLKLLKAEVLPNNDKSHAFHQRLGFSIDNCSSKRFIERGSAVNFSCYSLSSEKWENIKYLICNQITDIQ